jgi:hypothetical protein
MLNVVFVDQVLYNQRCVGDLTDAPPGNELRLDSIGGRVLLFILETNHKMCASEPGADDVPRR